MMSRLIRSFAAGVILLGIVVGVPVMLLYWGRSPLGGADSAWDQISELPTRTVSDTVAFGFLTIAAWVAWAMFSVHAVVELSAAAGKGLPWRLPGGPIQVAASRLVTALTMTVALASPLSQRAGAVPALPVVSQSMEIETRALRSPPDPVPPAVGDSAPRLVSPPIVSAAETAAPDVNPSQAPASQPVVTVETGDHPWGLAERHLGEGFRWREIWDLNRGVPQPDGRAWVAEDLIYPGWQFRLPADATNLPDEPPTSTEPGDERASDPPPSEPDLPPEPSDNNDPPVSPSTTQAGADTGDELVDASPGGPEDTSAAPDEPDDESPDNAEDASDVPTPPEDSAPPNDEATPDPAPSTSTTSVPEVNANAAPSSRSTDDAADPSPGSDEGGDDDGGGSFPAAPLLGVGGSLIAAGVAHELRRRRARQSVALPLGTVPSPSPQVPAASEILQRADEDATGRLDTALTHLANSLRARRGGDWVQPRVVQVSGSRIDVCLDRADPNPPTPWRPEASGLVWVLAEAQTLPFIDAPPPLPSLITVGAGDSDILIDIEAHGVVALVGNASMCQRMARSMVAELAVRGEGTVGTTLVGDVLGDSMMGFDGVNTTPSWSEIDTSVIASSARQLDTGQWPHTWAARASGRVFDGWAPSIWFTTPTDDSRYLAAVESIAARPGAGCAVVIVGGDPGCGLRIHVDSDGAFRIPELGLEGAAQLLGTEVTDQLLELLDDADLAETQMITIPDITEIDHAPVEGGQDDPDEAPQGTTEDEPHLTLLNWADTSDEVGEEVGDDYEDPDVDVLVRVCGPITVEGGKSDLPQRETAVAAFVALHGQADIDQIRNAVWAGADVSIKRAQNVISTVRRSVGEAITWTSRGHLACGSGLMTDLELIKRRLGYARHQTPESRLTTLRGGLDLVTGQVCTFRRPATRAWTWIELDGWIPHVEAIVGTLAADLGRLCLDLDDGHGAIEAAKRGIEAVGRRNELVILLVRGYEKVGDESEARAAMRSHERYLEDLGVDELDDELLELLSRYAAPVRSKRAR